MKAVDTNVVVRVLTNDEPVQSRLAASHLRSGPFWLASTVLLETEWVLRHAYGFDRNAINRGLAALIDLEGATVQHESAVRGALGWHSRGMDFADALHLAVSSHAQEFLTFDKKFAASAQTLGATPRVRVLE